MTHSLRPHGSGGTPLPPEQAVRPEAPGDTEQTPQDRQGRAGGRRADASGRGSAGGKPQPGRARDAFFDNAKFLAIVLVAVAHSWEPLRDGSRAVTGLYIFVYAFHMPAFIIISGYFSRSFDTRPDRLRRLVTGVAVPYIVFETAYPLFKRWGDHSPSQDISLLEPYFLTWFLVALFIWRLTSPIWRSMRWPLPVALAIAMAASVTPSITDGLNLQRVCQFLPYFVLGLILRPEHFALLRQRTARVIAVPVMLCAAVFAYWAAQHMNDAWLFHRDAAQELGAPWWAGIVMTLAVFGCSLVLTACFLALVPSRKTWFTALGAGTLCGYLLHGFVIKAAQYYGWYDDHPIVHDPVGEIMVSLFAAVLITLLCTPPVRRVFRFVVEPEMKWAFKKEAAGPPPRPKTPASS
ncbi:acyltransferase family protein [Streptomyces sp. NPDC050560]|uniref:acyltransferase family protein n=1 Tax=Streptomyces sp. NPDC050560 TaxID=3365630 RepID=UPI0037BD07D1